MVMAVQIPVAGLHVNLYITHPECAADAYLGIEEVGAGVAVVEARVDNLEGAAVSGVQLAERQQPMLPSILQQFFHRLRNGNAGGKRELLPRTK